MKEVPLTNGGVTMVDDEDFGLVSQYRWHVNKRGYVIRYFYRDGRHLCQLLHRYLLNPEKGRVIDHINQNKLDNQRNNLRVCTIGQNTCNVGKTKRNQAGYKGVYRYSAGKWRAQIGSQNKVCYIGYFRTPEEAALAYDAKAKELHGEFARLNFPVTA